MCWKKVLTEMKMINGCSNKVLKVLKGTNMYPRKEQKVTTKRSCEREVLYVCNRMKCLTVVI